MAAPNTVTFLLLALQVCVFAVLALSDMVHFGDIRLQPCTNPDCKTSSSVTGELQVYMNQGGENPTWKPICRDGFHDDGDSPICEILGYYKGSRMKAPGINALNFTPVYSYDYALTHLDCSKRMSNGALPNHLLHCDSDDWDQEMSCAGTLVLNCSEPKGFPLQKLDSAFNGQVQLCPPDQFFVNDSHPFTQVSQVSFGIVSVFLQKTWGSVNNNDPTIELGYYQANSICRQLGFTRAVSHSARTVKSYDTYTFYNCMHSRPNIQDVWLKVGQTSRCDSTPCPCFSCCYGQPKDGDNCDVVPNDSECPSHANRCCRKNDIVLECTFDTNRSPITTSGSSSMCAFETKDQSLLTSGVCTAETNFSEKEFLVGVLVPTVVLICVVVGVVVMYLRYRYRRRAGYQPVNNAQQPGANQNAN